MKDELKQYYSEAKLWLPEHSAQRQFRLRTNEGRFLKVKHKIGTINRLRKVLLRYLPTDVWYTASRWLNPEKIGSKKHKGEGYQIADKYLLGSDLPFDIDTDFSLEGVHLARKRTLDVIKIIKNPVKYIVWTGSKGFQTVFEECSDLGVDIKNIRKREEKLKEKRKVYINKIPIELISKKSDREVTTDSRRIIRLPLTCRDNGYVSTIITFDQMHLPVFDLVKLFKYYTLKRPGIPYRKMTAEKTPQGDFRLVGLKKPKEDRAGLRSPFIISISNEVGNRRIVLLRYNKHQKYKADIKKLQKKYKIGEMIVLKNEDDIWGLGILAFDIFRLRKIYQASRSVNKGQFEKYQKTFLRLPTLKEKPLEVDCLLRGEATELPYSVSFHSFLKAFGIDLAKTRRAMKNSLCYRILRYKDG